MANDLVMRIIMQANDRASQAFERISNASNSLSDSLHNQKHALREAEKAQKSFDKYKKTIQELRQTSTALRETQERIKELNRVQQQNGSLTQDQARELQQLRTRASQLASTQTHLRTTTQALRQELQQSGINTRNLSQAQNELRNRQENATRAIERQRAALERLNRAQRTVENANNLASKLQGAAGSAAIGAGVIGAGLIAPIKAYATAESAGTDLKVAMMDSSGKVAKEYQQIDALAVKLGDRLPGTTADFKNMMTALVKQGISAKSILGGTGEAAALLAVQLKKTPEEAAEMAAKLQDSLRASEKEMLGIMDNVQRMYYTGVDPTNILGAFGKFAASIDIVRFKGEDAMKMMGPMITMLDQSGLVGESAGNALGKVFGAMMSTSKIKKTIEDLQKEGLVGKDFNLEFTDGKGEFGGMDNAFKQLAKLKGLSTEARLEVLTQIWGNDAETKQALNTIIQKGKAGYDETAQKMAAQASLQQRVNATLGTVTNLWDSATGSFTNFMVAVGESIQNEIRLAVEWIDIISTRLGTWAKENPETANTILKIVAAIGAGLAIFAAFATVAAAVIVPLAMLKLSWLTLITNIGQGIGIISKITLFFKGTFLTIFAKANTAILKFGSLLWAAAGWIGKGIMLIGRTFLMNPIGLSITAIIGVLYLLWRNWDTVKEAIITGWTYLSTKLSNNYIVQALNTMINYFQVVGFSWQSVKTLIILIWTSIKISINQAIDSIAAKIRSFSPSAAFQSAFAAALAYLRGLGGQMTAIGASIVQGLINGIQSKISQVSSYFSQLRSMVSNFRMPSLPSIPTIATITKPAGFSTGGYTGAGGVNEPAGIAHRGEVIFSQADVKRFGGWQIVEKLRTQGIGALTNLINRPQASQLLTKIRAAKPMLTSLNLGGISGATIITAAEKLNAWLTGKNHTPTENHVPTIKGVISSPQASQQPTHLSAPTHIAGDTITIHLHAAPNMDIKTIADTIIQQLNKQKLAKQRRANSSFIDKD